MRIGVDFDNTLVCYDGVFHAAAVARGLVPAELPIGKDSVRDYLRRGGREDDWTELQGYIYGPGLRDAPAFPGALEFLRRCLREETPVWIISHRTRYPFRGPRYDLHAAARQWMTERGLFAAEGVGLAPERVCLELTKQDKLARLARVGCTHFVDDLPEFLAAPDFPTGVCRVLFDPHRRHAAETRFPRGESWAEIWELIHQ
jgi:hypothetical protein